MSLIWAVYLGTWIPCATARELCIEYNVLDVLSPLVDPPLSELEQGN